MIVKLNKKLIISRLKLLTAAIELIASFAIANAGSLSLLGAGQFISGSPPAGITQVQKNGGTSTSNANITTSLPGGTTIGNSIIIIATGEGTISTPAGFISRNSQVNINGFYVFEKLNASGDASDTPTLVMSGAFNSTWLIAEYSGITAFDVGNGSNQGFAPNTNATTASVTPTAGSRLIIASFGITGSGSATTFSAGDPKSWTNSFLGQQSVQMVGVGARDPLASGWATLAVTADGSTAYSTNASFATSGGANNAPANITVVYR